MENKTRFRAGLAFGVLMAVFYMLQNIVMRDNLTTARIVKSVAIGLIAGALAGFIFGWLIGLFMNSKSVQKATAYIPAAGENIIFKTAASHYKGFEAVGGKLYLTNTKLVFISHKMNIHNHRFETDLKNITAVSRYKSAGIINNGLTILTLDGGKEKFVVESPEEWLRYLNQYTAK